MRRGQKEKPLKGERATNDGINHDRGGNNKKTDTENKNNQGVQTLREPQWYVIYSNPQEFNRHFHMCRRREIPFLAVSRRGDSFSIVEFDLITAETLFSHVGYEDLLALRVIYSGLNSPEM